MHNTKKLHTFNSLNYSKLPFLILSSNLYILLAAKYIMFFTCPMPFYFPFHSFPLSMYISHSFLILFFPFFAPFIRYNFSHTINISFSFSFLSPFQFFRFLTLSLNSFTPFKLFKFLQLYLHFSIYLPFLYSCIFLLLYKFYS